MKKPSIRTLRKHLKDFCNLRDDKDLAELLEVPAYKLQLIAIRPQYRMFGIPKSNGSKRWIEDPEPNLKYIQKSLNKYLQSIYYFHGTKAAYGFILSPSRDPDPRNILTNAQRHLGNDWLYNVDVEDFFHQVSFEEVYQIFIREPFDFEEKLAILITQLCTHQERLPMGAPTSPVLSNFACIDMDKELLTLAEWAGWTFTRFADDMSFSARTPFDEEAQSNIKHIVHEYTFWLNEEKEKYYGPEDTKMVTGLVLGREEVELPEDFMDQLREEIHKLNHVIEVQYRFGNQSEWVNEYEERIEGMLTFAAFVLGPYDKSVMRAEKALEAAKEPKDEFGAFSWLEFGYF